MPIRSVRNVSRHVSVLEKQVGSFSSRQMTSMLEEICSSERSNEGKKHVMAAHALYFPNLESSVTPQEVFARVERWGRNDTRMGRTSNCE